MAGHSPVTIKIAIFQNDLKMGGIQKSLINLLNFLDPDRYDIDLFLYDDDHYFNAAFTHNVRVTRLKKWNPLLKAVPFNILNRFCKAQISDKEYDAAIDFNSYQSQCAVHALGVRAKKRVMWIHNNVEQKIKEEFKYRLLWALSKPKLKLFDEFAAVSKGIVTPFRNFSGVHDKPVRVIPNCIDTEEIMNKSRAEIEDFGLDPQKYNIVALGRLCRAKGFDILINHMSEIVKRRGDTHLYIIGDGRERKSLLRQIKQKELESHITLLGGKSNPYAYMRQMDAFVSVSRYEGQGMNIMEARALGLPVFISKNLEQYNEGIEGYGDIAGALINAKKGQKQPDALDDYNRSILDRFEALVCGGGHLEENR